MNIQRRGERLGRNRDVAGKREWRDRDTEAVETKSVKGGTEGRREGGREREREPEPETDRQTDRKAERDRETETGR